MIDTNSVIDLKKLPLDKQWSCCEKLQSLVEQGRIAFPRQVVDELRHVDFPDLPGAWLVGKAAAAMQHSEPVEETSSRFRRSSA